MGGLPSRSKAIQTHREINSWIFPVPVPSSVVHLTEALRRFLVRKDEEALSGTVKHGRIKVVKERKGSEGRAGGSPWRQPIDLRYAAPPDGRPRSSSGATSFHFRGKRASKQRPSGGTGKIATGKASSGSGGGLDPATRFERYVSDEPKLQPVSAAQFERYLEEPKQGSENDVDPVNDPSRAVLVASNISAIAAEREDFWRQCWAAARTAGAQRVELFAERGSASEWGAVAADPATPAPVAIAARTISQELAASGGANDGKAGGKRSGQVIELDKATHVDWALELGNRFGSSRSERMIHYPKPRAGRVQEQFDVEIPAECDEADIAAIVGKLAADLDSLGVRYTIVVHVPDKNNDRRNYHIHFIMYLGRCTLAPDGSWKFDAKPGEPPKLRPGEIAVGLGAITVEKWSSSHHNALAAEDMRALRMRYAEHVNERLTARKSDRSYDPRTYVEIGIDRQPARHLGSAAARLVAAGVPVEIDIANAINGWSSIYRELDRAGLTRRYDRGLAVQSMRRSADIDSVGNNDSDGRLEALIGAWVTAGDEALEGRLAIDRLDAMRAEAESAARRLLKNTTRLIEAIDAGHAKPEDRRNERYIRHRHLLAGCHLSEIAEAIEPWAADVEIYRQQVAAAESNLRLFSAQAEQILKERRAEKARADERMRVDWRTGTALPSRKYPDPLTGHRHVDALLEYMRTGSQKEAATAGWPLVYLIRDNADRIQPLGLGPLDNAVLRNPQFAGRIDAAMFRLIKLQGTEVGRLIKFMEQHGPDALVAARRSDEAAELVSIKSLYAVYRNHPRFLRSLEKAQMKAQIQRLVPRHDRLANAPWIDPIGRDHSLLVAKPGNKAASVSASISAASDARTPILVTAASPSSAVSISPITEPSGTGARINASLPTSDAPRSTGPKREEVLTANAEAMVGHGRDSAATTPAVVKAVPAPAADDGSAATKSGALLQREDTARADRASEVAANLDAPTPPVRNAAGVDEAKRVGAPTRRNGAYPFLASQTLPYLPDGPHLSLSRAPLLSRVQGLSTIPSLRSLEPLPPSPPSVRLGAAQAESAAPTTIPGKPAGDHVAESSGRGVSNSQSRGDLQPSVGTDEPDAVIGTNLRSGRKADPVRAATRNRKPEGLVAKAASEWHEPRVVEEAHRPDALAGGTKVASPPRDLDAPALDEAPPTDLAASSPDCVHVAVATTGPSVTPRKEKAIKSGAPPGGQDTSNALGVSIEAVRRKVSVSAAYRSLSDSEQRDYNEWAKIVIRYLAEQSAVLRFDGDDLNVSLRSETMLADIRKLADTEIGFRLLSQIAKNVQYVLQTREPIDWVRVKPVVQFEDAKGYDLPVVNLVTNADGSRNGR
ncbi:MobA/MobL family protein [Sphingomonas sp. PB2P19]|uniref:MobA/MobL family protein n=1 Tax=Sphingomonas rhamnosi TaxID=3096156 RepID=UPI002FC74673